MSHGIQKILKNANSSVYNRLGQSANGDVFAARFDLANSRFRITGGSWLTQSHGAQNFDYIVFLRNIFASNQTKGWAGEFILYNSAISDADMNDKFNRLNSKWFP